MNYFKNAKLPKKISPPFRSFKEVPFKFKLFIGAMMASHITFYSVIFSAALNISFPYKKKTL